MNKLDLLVIDDEPIMKKVFEKLLRTEVYSFDCISDPELALKVLKECRPALVLLDYHMPEMSGREMIIKISEAHMFTSTRFFLYTSDILDESQVIQMRTLGLEGVIQKPIEKEKLLELIQESKQQMAA